jgi:hypothetical protein
VETSPVLATRSLPPVSGSEKTGSCLDDTHKRFHLTGERCFHKNTTWIFGAVEKVEEHVSNAQFRFGTGNLYYTGRSACAS